MPITRFVKPAFCVIGKEGATSDGPDFIARLWREANAYFPEVQPLAKMDENGCFAGFWGAMTDPGRNFLPWEEGFTRGLYLAGVECRQDVAAPEGWTRWAIPGFEYLKAESGEDVFPQMLAYIAKQGLTLAGAVQDFTDPADGKAHMLFPIRRL